MEALLHDDLAIRAAGTITCGASVTRFAKGAIQNSVTAEMGARTSRRTPVGAVGARVTATEIALLFRILNAIATERTIEAFRGACTVNAVLVRRSVVAFLAYGCNAITASWRTFGIGSAEARECELVV